MSFDLNAAGSYGSGSLGDVTDPPAPYINAYAAVEEFHANYFYATPIYETDYLSWDNCIGCQVLFHAVAAKAGNSSYLGQYLFNTITGREEDDDGIRFNVAEPMASLMSKDSTIFWQAILIPEFKNLTLQSKNLKPLSYALNNVPLGGMNPYLAPCGGLLVFKCSDTLTLAGGHIDLRDAGFPTNVNTTYRPNLSHENNGTLDTDTYSGSENSITKDRLLLNAGDGACFIMAKTINCASGSSRIGNPSTSGVQYCRGASDSPGLPANVTNLGGSSIAIVTHLFNNFSPNLIAKYRSGSGRGLARAYLAVLNAHNSPKPDEGLYALDTISRTDRVKSMCNISGFGKGSDGSYSLAADARKCWNSYAAVTAISGRVYSISRLSADVEELTNFEVGRLVLIHQSRTASASDWQDGRFFLSRITAISGSTVTIKHNFSFNLSTYNVQMIVVPEFQNLTLPTEYKNTPRYSRGAGGIFAIAVNGTCNLSGGKINMEGKGTFSSVVNPIISNYSMKGSLPLGQGNGSVFILARNLTMNTSTRIGATYDGSIFGGRGGAGDKSSYPAGGGYSGSPGASSSGETKNPGWGGGAGIHPDYDELSGGWHSNAGTADYAEENGGSTGCQGAHILIVADSISGFNLSALSTGGGSGYAPGNYGQEPGGCGYGGGGKIIANNGGTAGAGGYQGGGVGGAGAAFVYANNISEQVTTGLVLF